MTLTQGGDARCPTPEELEAILRMTPAELARLVLCLLVEEALAARLAAFRAQQLPAEPAERQGELGL